MIKKSVLTLITAILLFPAVSLPAGEMPGHTEEINAYRERREAGLQRPNGWLTLVGLHWLEAGDNRIGAADDNDIVLSGGPEYWGTVNIDEGKLHFTGIEGSDATYGDGTVNAGPMVADTQGKPTLISAGTLSFYAIERGSFALRVKDSQASTRLNFKGLEYFPVDSDWLIEADVELAGPGETIPIANVLGQLNDSPKYATISFTLDEQEYRLDAITEEGDSSLFFIFADRTNSHETYGAGRFLYTGMPENGKLMIDFNRAYNPPCAFNDYSTCPLPPPQNRLDLRVTAGELDFHVPGLKSYGREDPDTSSR